MRKSSVGVVTAVMIAWLCGGGSAAAQSNVRIEVEGLQPDADVVVVLAFANLNKSEPAVPTGGGGSLDFISDFANLGKTPSDAETPTEVYVYYDRCEDPDQMLFSDTPRDDEECRDPLGIIFISSRTTGIIANVETGTVQPVEDGPPGGAPPGSAPPTGGFFGGGQGFLLSFGVGRYEFTDAEQSPERQDAGGGFTAVRRTADLTKSGPISHVDAAYWPSRFVGVGFSWEYGGEVVNLSETFDIESPGGTIIPGLQRNFDGFVKDFNLLDVGVLLGAPIGPIHPHVMLGMSRFSATSGAMLRDTADGEVLQEASQMQDDSGTGFIWGIEVTGWLTDRFGVSGYFKKTDLEGSDNMDNEGEFKETFRKFGVNLIVKLWG